MGPARWKRLAEAVARRYRALLAVLRDPQGAKEKAAAAEAARCALRVVCPPWQHIHTPLAFMAGVIGIVALHRSLATYLPWRACRCLLAGYDCIQMQGSRAGMSCAGKSASARGQRRGRS